MYWQKHLYIRYKTVQNNGQYKITENTILWWDILSIIKVEVFVVQIDTVPSGLQYHVMCNISANI